MLDDLTNDSDGGSIYESFSDFALCSLAVALLLVTLLAINITQNVNVQINRSKFSGGVMRPSFYVECTVPDFSRTVAENLAVERALFGDTPYVAVHLFSPSLAMIATDVREGGTVALGEDETFALQQDMPLYQFMQLAPGIEPGSFEAEGHQTALLLPSILDKQMVYEPMTENGYRANADRRLTRSLLGALWPVYNNPVFPARKPEEYSHARTRVFVETQTVQTRGGEEHYIVIGHSSYKLPEALDDGSLAWLGGFSSGLTEIVFLGEIWSDPENRTNKRIEFFKRSGFRPCAIMYRDYAFPSEMSPELEKLRNTLLTLRYPVANADTRAREALAQKQASAALLSGALAANEGGYLPPLLVYPDAWKAYIAHYEKEQPDPPKWFYSEFLDRIGFDRLTIEGSPR